MALSVMKVGSPVRVKLNEANEFRRRAVVATVNDTEETVTVLLDDDAPQPLILSSSSERFWVTPRFSDNLIKNMSNSEGGEEWTVSITDVSELFDFEQEEECKDDADACTTKSVQTWKDRGDQLLISHDPSAAASYYERALSLTSSIQIGGTVLVKVSGRAVTAEVDCIDDTDDDERSTAATTTIDITMVESGEERTIKESEIMLALLEPDPDVIQERILLNLTRCLLQLAERTVTASRRQSYFRGAVLGSTLALAVCHFHKDDDKNLTKTEQAALMLRSQAQSGVNKFAHAIADMKLLLTYRPQRRDVRKAYAQLEKKRNQLLRSDKRLAKEVSQWVQTAMTEPTTTTELAGMERNVSSRDTDPPLNEQEPIDLSEELEKVESVEPPDTIPVSLAASPPRLPTIPWFSLIFMVMIAWMLQDVFPSLND